MLNFISWLIFGAVAGWLASLIMKTNRSQGLLTDIIVGIVGAFIGGFIATQLLGINVGDPNSVFNITALLVAVVGAVILLAIVKAVTGRRTV